MRKIILLSLISVSTLPAMASAAGCLKGAAAGAVAGHYMGHHAIKGALAGCVVGHYAAKGMAAHKAAVQQRQLDAPRPMPMDDTPMSHGQMRPE